MTAKGGMTPAGMGQHNRDQILQILGYFGPLRTEDLAKRIGLSEWTTRGHIKALRAAGLVERCGHAYRLVEPAPD